MLLLTVLLTFMVHWAQLTELVKLIVAVSFMPSLLGEKIHGFIWGFNILVPSWADR
jgi:hypothetical protein